MSNEHKDWLWDHIQDIIIERGLADTITDIEPQSPSEGAPHHVRGIKKVERVKYYIHYDPDFGWLCEHRELD